jgi:HSP20 family protein
MMANNNVELQTNNGRDGGRGNEAKPKTEKTEQKAALSRGEPFPLASARFLRSPFSMISAFLDDIDRLARGVGIDEASSSHAQGSARSRGSTSPVWTLPVDVSERDGKLLIVAEAPGMDKDSISVDIDADRVVISGERIEQHDTPQGSLHVSERRYGHFSRTIGLPPGARADEATASFANGILEIEIPLDAQSGMRRLEVRDGGESKRAKPEGTEA